MNKAIISFAHGDAFVNLLKVALPTFYKYSVAHNYDLIIPTYQEIINICNNYGWDYNRPTSWLKVPLIKYFLESKYDLVQWIDSDVVINKFDIDINADFKYNQYSQAFVSHIDKYEGVVPNCGIWGLKKSGIPLLQMIWDQTEYINHKWWEQGANIHLMKTLGESYVDKCYVLPYQFNVHRNDMRFTQQDWEKDGIMLHATTWPDRLAKMKEWASNV
jgi:hypothetical protein